MALAAALALEGKRGLAFLAAGTDGRDGATPAAGAAVSGDCAPLARRRGLDPEARLRDNDSFGFFRAARTGRVPCLLLPQRATGTNVMDLYIGLKS